MLLFVELLTAPVLKANAFKPLVLLDGFDANTPIQNEYAALKEGLRQQAA